MAKTKGRINAILIGALAIVGLALICAVQFYRHRKTSDLDQALVNAKAAGLGVDETSFKSDLPNSENAWIKLRPIVSSIIYPELKTMAHGIVKAEDLATDRDAVAKIRPLLQPVQDTRLDRWEPHHTQFQLITNDGSANDCFLNAQNVFAASSYYKALKGDWRGAENDLKTAIKIDGCALADPTLGGAYRTYRQNSVIRRTIATELAATKNLAKVQHLADQVLPLLSSPDADKTIASNCAILVTSLSEFKAGTLDLDKVLKSYLGSGLENRLPPNYDALKLETLRYFTDFVNAAKSHEGDPVAMSKAASLVSPPTYQKFSGDQVISNLFLPGNAATYLYPGLDKTEDLLLRTGLQLEAYKELNGRYPARLNDLQTAPEPDPLTKKPLNYRLDGKGFVLWSVGYDLADQGAVMKNDFPKDLIFQTADPSRPLLLGR